MRRKKDLTAAQIEKNIEQWKSVSPAKFKELKRKVEAMAAASRAKKNAVFTARLRRDDLDNFKKIAEKKRIPYQTLLGHVIHAYATGILVDVSEVEKILKKKLKAG